MNDSSIKMKDILSSPDGLVRQTKGVGGILAGLYRTLLKDVNMRKMQFDLMLTRYSKEAKQKLDLDPSNTKQDRYFAAGNLERELEKNDMTWKVFVKGIKLFKPIRVKFIIELEHAYPILKGQKITQHSFSVNLNDPGDSDSYDPILLSDSNVPATA